ncbi:MAG: fimbrillin family protein [Bacteroides sp.]|nr:fimbrillin family protein [Bacteroides sp.]
MKKCNIIMALAATTVFAACNNDNELVQQKVSGEEVNFFIDNAPITRTSVNTSDASTKFVENDQIGIYATGGATASNVGYQVGAGSDGALSPISGTINWSSEAAGNFYAYYPYASTQSATGKVTFTVSNQDTEANFNKNDFLTATTTDVTYQSPINFKFAHALSLVQVSLSGDYASNATAVTIAAQPTVEWTYANNTLATNGEATTINMWKISPDAQEYWAMVPAQTISNGTVLFTITTSGDTYTYKPTSDIEIKTAHSKKFNLQLGPNATVTSIATDINTDGWTEDTEESGDTEKVELPAVELISETAGMFTAETAITEQTSKQNCVEGWNTVTGSGANATIQFDEAENAVSLSSTSGSWYNATLYYCTKENAATASKYTLTFDLKASEACDIQLALMPCIVDNLYFVQDNSSLSPVSYSSATTEWVTKTLTFDLSKIKNKTTSDAELRTATTEDLAKVLVYFTPKTKSEAILYIQNVKLVEKK